MIYFCQNFHQFTNVRVPPPPPPPPWHCTPSTRGVSGTRALTLGDTVQSPSGLRRFYWRFGGAQLRIHIIG